MPGSTPISTSPSSGSLLVPAEWEKLFKNKKKKTVSLLPKENHWIWNRTWRNPHPETLVVVAAISVARTEAEAEAPILGPPDEKSQLVGKDPDAGKDWGQDETEDKIVGWHHWFNGPEFEQTPGDSEGQESLVCCSPWGHEESNTT